MIETPLIISEHDKNTSTAPSTGWGTVSISSENRGTNDRIKNPVATL
jgi:hypothetical protein